MYAIRQVDDASRPLPSRPALLFGRDSELDALVSCVAAPTPARVAILGAGGMGKSSLALSLLHHERAASVFGSYRYFVSCDCAESAGGFISELAAHLGIAGQQLRKRVLLALAQVRTLLVLDNFESPWENYSARVQVEEVLSALAAVKSVSLVLTLRGTERPAGVNWSAPLSKPILPIHRHASMQLFASISGASADDQLDDVRELLDLLEDVPLAVTLVAQLAESETPRGLLRRWNIESTSMVCSGDPNSRHACLDTSIRLSISSPRVQTVPQALDLLSLLSLLPSGLPNDLQHPHFIAMSKCAAVLKRSALAYSVEGDRLRVLSPIRAYVLKNHPPPYELIAPMQDLYLHIADLCQKIGSHDNQPIIRQLVSEAANVESLCSYILEHVPGADWPISVIARFDSYLLYAGISSSALLARACAKARSPEQLLPVLMRRIVRAPTFAEQEKIAREALVLARASHDVAHEAEALLRLSIARNAHPDASNFAQQGLRLFERLGAKYLWRQGCCLRSLAYYALLHDDYTSAIALGEDAIQRFDACDAFSDSMDMRAKQVHPYLRQGEFDKAEQAVNTSAQQARILDDSAVLATSLASRADIAVARGDFDEALEFHEAATALYKRRGDNRSFAFTQLNVASLLVTRGELFAARSAMQQGAVWTQFPGSWGDTMSQSVWARLTLAEGDLEEATARAWTTIALARRGQSIRMEGLMHQVLCDVALSSDVRDTAEATTRAILSLAQFAKVGNILYMLHAIAKLAEVLAAAREPATARAVYRWALVWSKKIGMKAVQAECLAGIARLGHESATNSLQAWTTALRAARLVCHKRLEGECEAQLAYLDGTSQEIQNVNAWPL